MSVDLMFFRSNRDLDISAFFSSFSDVRLIWGGDSTVADIQALPGKIGKVDSQTKNVIGGTICMWHDRAVANEEDILKMNPVYPGMLAFAERSWLGGGRSEEHTSELQSH